MKSVIVCVIILTLLPGIYPIDSDPDPDKNIPDTETTDESVDEQPPSPTIDPPEYISNSDIWGGILDRMRERTAAMNNPDIDISEPCMSPTGFPTVQATLTRYPPRIPVTPPVPEPATNNGNNINPVINKSSNQICSQHNKHAAYPSKSGLHSNAISINLSGHNMSSPSIYKIPWNVLFRPVEFNCFRNQKYDRARIYFDSKINSEKTKEDEVNISS